MPVSTQAAISSSLRRLSSSRSQVGARAARWLRLPGRMPTAAESQGDSYSALKSRSDAASRVPITVERLFDLPRHFLFQLHERVVGRDRLAVRARTQSAIGFTHHMQGLTSEKAQRSMRAGFRSRMTRAAPSFDNAFTTGDRNVSYNPWLICETRFTTSNARSSPRPSSSLRMSSIVRGWNCTRYRPSTYSSPGISGWVSVITAS